MDPHHKSLLYNEYKTRNILSLHDRVAVIRAYECPGSKPSYQRLASKFDCSSKQIKNILANRDTILKFYEECGEDKYDRQREDSCRKRQDKIDFLGKVMYEYIQRMLYFNQPINEERVRQKAMQIKECIAIENFQPNDGWFRDFRVAYGIPACDVQTLRNNVQLTGKKRPQLNIIDIIQYVTRQEQKMKRGRPSHPLRPSHIYEGIDDDSDDDDDDEENMQRSNGNVTIIKLETCDEAQRNLVENNNTNINNNNCITICNTKNDTIQTFVLKTLTKSDSGSTPPPAKRGRANSPLPDIENSQEALKHIKVLEVYAMLQDNYRAIGLLTQLEQVFKNPPPQP